MKKNKNINIRISEDDQEALNYISKRYKVNISEIIRKTIIEIRKYLMFYKYSQNKSLEELITIAKTKWLDDDED